MIAAGWRSRLRSVDPVRRFGVVHGLSSSLIEADGPDVSLGTVCEIEAREQGAPPVLAEVVRIERQRVLLSPFDATHAIAAGATVTSRGTADRVAAGKALLGRAVDGLGRALDGKPLLSGETCPLRGDPPSPLERTSPNTVFVTGIRAIDGLLTLGEGQRIGIFAASGVGKTSLLTQIATQATADITIAALIGERGREVESFWHEGLTDEARARTTLVAATSDQAAGIRVRAGHYAIALADYWRARGKRVLLLVDSVTRLAMAMREIGLAAGEPPTIRGYTPNVFSDIPRMVERGGALRAGGAITAILTVLSETDDVDDPISEMMKSLLDGHFILSRALSEQGHFPAIDVPRSISRRAHGLRNAAENAGARRVAEWLSLLESSRLMRDSGLYAAGSAPDLDLALGRQPQIAAFLKQDLHHRAELASTRSAIAALVAGNA